MNDPVSDLVVLKKICTELQQVMAYSQPDREAVARLAEDVVFIGEELSKWAIGK